MTSLVPKSSLIVYHTAGKFEVLPPSAHAILGEYVEDGTNHGRMVYRNTQQNGLKVILFYWDSRDGKELSGWWFGDKLGGGQVWAHIPEDSAHPPQKGWHCPVDGPVQEHVVCVPKVRSKPEAPLDGEDEPTPYKQGEAKRSFYSPVSVPAKRQRKEEEDPITLVAQCEDKDEAPDSVLVLLGEYVENGTNHGRKSFLKKSVDGASPVWLYYWDMRDGKEHSGWWFGESVGGAEVFGKAPQHSPMPPTKSWRIPHDSSVKHDFNLTPLGHEEEQDMSEDERLQKATKLTEDAESQSEKVMETTASLLARTGEVFEDGIRAVKELLEGQLKTLDKAKASLARHRKVGKRAGSSELTEAKLSVLGERLDSVIGRMAKELTRAQERLEEVEQAGAEERDAQDFESRLPTVMELTIQAEMAVDQASTDAAASKCRGIVDKALQETEKALEDSKRFAPEARRLAVQEFTSLCTRCELASKKLAMWYSSQKPGPESATAADLAPLEDGMEEVADEVMDETNGNAEEVDNETPEGELIQKATDQVVDIEAKASQALQTAQVVLQDEKDAKGAQMVIDLLEEQRLAILKSLKVVNNGLKAAEQRALDRTTAKVLQALVPRLRAVRSKVTAEKARAQQVCEQQDSSVALPFEDALTADNSLAAVAAAVAQAEEAVQAVAVRAGEPKWRRAQMDLGVELAGEYGDAVRKAVEEMQGVADKAQAAILAARAGIDAQLKAARQLSEVSQKRAFAEIAPLRKSLVEAQKKLNPFKKARAEYEDKLQAKQELEEISNKLSAAKKEVDKISVTIKDEVDKAEQSIPEVQARLAETMQLLQKRKTTAEGDSAMEKIVLMMEQGRDLRKEIDGLKGQVSESKRAALAREIVMAAEAEVGLAETFLKKIEQAEKPWANGVEYLPKDKALAAFAVADAIPEEATLAVENAKTTIMEKLVEVKQIPDGTARFGTTEELMTLRARTDEVELRLTQLKVDTFARRTVMTMQAEFEKVVKAETEIKKLVAVAAPLSEDLLEQKMSQKIKDACKKTLELVKQTSKYVLAAREAVDTKKQDPKAKGTPSVVSQLSRLTERLEKVESTVSGLREGAENYEGSQKQLEKRKKEIVELTKAVGEVEVLTLPLGDERPSEQSEEEMAVAINSVQDQLSSWRNLADSMVNPGALRIAMQRVISESDKLQKRMDEMKRATSDRAGRAMCRVYLKEGRNWLEKVESAMAKAEQAEGPFLIGVELPKSESTTAIQACQAAATAVREVLDRARSWLKARIKEVSVFADSHEETKASASSLVDLSHRVDAVMAKLLVYEGSTESRKRAALLADAEPAAKAAKLS